MSKQCEYLHCTNLITGYGKKYCSLSCSSKEYQRTKSKRTKNCLYCGEPFILKRGDSRRKFCNSSCAASYNNKGVRRNFKGTNKYTKDPTYQPKHRKQREPLVCKVCGGTTLRKSALCSTECKKKHLVAGWLAGEIDGGMKSWGQVRTFVREYMLERAEYRCEGTDDRINDRCAETRVLQIDHINGDSTNSRVENLQVLCPTCHALTPTYGNKGNRTGKGRKERRALRNGFTEQ